MKNKDRYTTPTPACDPPASGPSMLHRQPRDLSIFRADPQWPVPKTPEAAKAALRSAMIANADGVLWFGLTRDLKGVHVTYGYDRRSDGTTQRCSAVFNDEESFVRWLDACDVRLRYTAMSDRLRGIFAELIASKDDA